jgi:hypothetical protein
MQTNDDSDSDDYEGGGVVAGGDKKQEGKQIPPSAWRPFERGPRNCIGQELANIEARVILACVVRKYAFEKVGAGQRLVDGKLVGEVLINVSVLSCSPLCPCMGMDRAVWRRKLVADL